MNTSSRMNNFLLSEFYPLGCTSICGSLKSRLLDRVLQVRFEFKILPHYNFVCEKGRKNTRHRPTF